MIYEVTLFQTYYGQQCLNRWNYLMTGTPAVVTGSFGLLDAMGAIPDGVTGLFPTGGLLATIQTVQSSAVAFDAIVAKAVYDVTDFYELPYIPAKNGDQGTFTGLSPTTSYGFRSNRTRTDIRRGMKRFVGVTENGVVGGGTIEAGMVGALNDIAEAMSDALTYTDEGNDLTFSPIIVSKQAYTPAGSTREAYQYYPTLSEQMDHIAQSILWQPYAQTRTQTSRQYGRGQ